jgi:hypothetical protein
MINRTSVGGSQTGLLTFLPTSRLHVFNSAYESPYDFVHDLHDLHTKGLEF